jgi:hypothetical protein
VKRATSPGRSSGADEIKLGDDSDERRVHTALLYIAMHSSRRETGGQADGRTVGQADGRTGGRWLYDRLAVFRAAYNPHVIFPARSLRASKC